MKVKIVKEVKRSDDLWRFACGDVYNDNAYNVWISPHQLHFPFAAAFTFLSWSATSFPVKLKFSLYLYL